MTVERSICIFWDGSNIFVPARHAAADKEGPYHAKGVRIQIDNLYTLARANRVVSRSVYVGSVAPSHPIVGILRLCGMDVETFEAGELSGKEQAVDQALQVHMLRALADLTPGIAVLLAGDGAGFKEGRGYFADLQRMHAKGWGIEVLAWEGACHRQLQSWAEEHGTFIALDRYYEHVTFLEGIRRSKPLPATAMQRRAVPVDQTREPDGRIRPSEVKQAPLVPDEPKDVSGSSISAAPIPAPAALPAQEVLHLQVCASKETKPTRQRYKSRTTTPRPPRTTRRAKAFSPLPAPIPHTTFDDRRTVGSRLKTFLYWLGRKNALG